MKMAYGAVAVVLLALATVSWGGIGQAQQGAAEKTGEKLDEVGRAIKKGLQNARGAVYEEFAKTREAVHDMGIMSRVYGRLHWEKALTTSVLELKVEAGIVTLRGAVSSPDVKKKAVTLVQDTVGVTKVIDQLSVLSPHAEPDTPRATTRP